MKLRLSFTLKSENDFYYEQILGTMATMGDSRLSKSHKLYILLNFINL